MSLRSGLRVLTYLLVGSLLFVLVAVCTIAFLSDHDCSPGDYVGCKPSSVMSAPNTSTPQPIAGGFFLLLGNIAVYALPIIVVGGPLILVVWALFVVAGRRRQPGGDSE